MLIIAEKLENRRWYCQCFCRSCGWQTLNVPWNNSRTIYTLLFCDHSRVYLVCSNIALTGFCCFQKYGSIYREKDTLKFKLFSSSFILFFLLQNLNIFPRHFKAEEWMNSTTCYTATHILSAKKESQWER